MKKSYSIVVVGAGVVGLAIARELLMNRKGSVLVLEKESNLGFHSSGRNSGVIHAGIYYTAGSLKARMCVEGSQRLLEYCSKKGIRSDRIGKVVVAPREDLIPGLDLILKRGRDNGVDLEEISLAKLRELEPEAVSCGYALWSPNTGIVDSIGALQSLREEVEQLGGSFCFGEKLVGIDTSTSTLLTVSSKSSRRRMKIGYDFLVNAAGLHAEKIAQEMGYGQDYKILPFKGIYWGTSDSYSSRIRHLIYPTPDLAMPFLGVHVTKNVQGKVLLGPTAIPAFGRENYGVFSGMDVSEVPTILGSLAGLMIRNPDNFRGYVSEEFKRYFRKQFLRETQKLTPGVVADDLTEIAKVGLRAQLYDKAKGKMEMDFVVEKGPNSLHILNAVSPAFTSSMAFARHVVEMI